MVFFGWNVVNSIPFDTYAGLITGQYQLSGGVIRWAKGTAHGGRIVRHLLPSPFNLGGIAPGLELVSGIASNIQLADLRRMSKLNTQKLIQISGRMSSLSDMTKQVLSISTGTAFISGLGLTVSCVGFVLISKKLNLIDNKLKHIQKDVKAIKHFLESSERARLYYALNELSKICSQTPLEHRHTILHNSRKTFGEINMRYRELLSHAETVETAMVYEEYFSLTALAMVRCTAELGILNVAFKEIEEFSVFWQSQARRITKDILIGKYPERFLATDFATDVSVVELAEWLDFIYNKKNGLRWIDALRLEINETWYSEDLFSKASSFLSADKRSEAFVDRKSGLNKNIGIGKEKEQKVIIPAIRKLIARNSIYEGFLAQYQMLEEYNTKPSEFEQLIKQVPESNFTNGYLILEPTIAKTPAATI